MANSPLPDPTPVLDLIEAFRRSKTLFAAVALGIFDRLHDGPADLAALFDAFFAAGEPVELGALERLLDACTALGLLSKDERGYANSALASAYLRRGSPHTLAGYILYSNRVLYALWANLEDAVREGTSRWRQTFDLEGDLFRHLDRTAEAQREFLAGMNGFGLLSSPRVVAAFDLGRFHRLVDLGGGTGHLAVAACERYRELRAVVWDLPSVVEIAKEYISRSSAAPRIAVEPGDFFHDPLPNADLYALARVLHDWSEAKIRALLKKIAERLPEGGGLLVAEHLLDERKTGPPSALLQSLNMLVCTEGKERTLAEYTALLRDAGFSRVDAVKTGAPLDAILAVKEA